MRQKLSRMCSRSLPLLVMRKLQAWQWERLGSSRVLLDNWDRDWAEGSAAIGCLGGGPAAVEEEGGGMTMGFGFSTSGVPQRED